MVYVGLKSALRFGATLLVAGAVSAFAAPVDGVEFFELKIRPILANRCFACHAANAMGGLAMNSRAGLLKGGASGPALVPGKPEESLMIRAVEHATEKIKMPMGQAKLPDSEVQALTAWVKAGAIWPDTAAPAPPPNPKGRYVITPEQRAFWAFQPIAKPTAAASIDGFVHERLKEKGLTPNAPANRRDLLRRAYLDLTGLPPTYEESQAFIKDASPNAFAKVVDRLLASPRYGERWGRYTGSSLFGVG